MKSKLNYREIFFFPKARPYVLLTLICLVLSAYLGQLLPKIVFDLSKNYSKGSLFFQSIDHLLYLLLIIFIVRFGFQIVLNKFVMVLIENIRNNCYENWLNSFDFQRSYNGFVKEEEYPMGEVIARIMSDTQSIRELLSSGALTIVFNIIFVGSCAAGFIKIDSFLGLVIVVAEVVFSAILIYGSKYMREIFHEVRKSRSFVSRQIANATGGTKDAYFFGHCDYARNTGEKTYSDFMAKQLKSNVWDATYYSVAESLYPILLALVLIFSPYSQVLEGAIIFTLVDLIQRSIDPIKNIAGKIAVIQRAHTGIVRVQAFYQHLNGRLKSENIKHLNGEILNQIDVHIPNYTYPKRKGEEEMDKQFSLKEIEFSAKSGELIGIVGISGCGKSTLLKLLSANIIPTEGGVNCHFINGQLLAFPGEKGEGLGPYRELTSIVSQDSHVFSESLRFNISMGDIKNDQLDEFWKWVTSELPYLQHWGIELDDKIELSSISAGQKQLISALRACFLHKNIVFFDEISSALDSELEDALRKLVLIIQKQSITFIVAHRVETIINSNLILVMDHGKVIGQGQHQDLLSNSPFYQELISKLR